MTKIEIQRLMNECDMLEGNINRIMVTSSERELEKMYIVALNRLNKIFEGNKERIKGK